MQIGDINFRNADVSKNIFSKLSAVVQRKR